MKKLVYTIKITTDEPLESEEYIRGEINWVFPEAQFLSVEMAEHE